MGGRESNSYINNICVAFVALCHYDNMYTGYCMMPKDLKRSSVKSLYVLHG